MKNNSHEERKNLSCLGCKKAKTCENAPSFQEGGELPDCHEKNVYIFPSGDGDRGVKGKQNFLNGYYPYPRH